MNKGENSYSVYAVNTIPASISSKSFGVSTSSKTSTGFDVITPATATGSQIELYTVAGKKVKTTTFSLYTSISTKENVAYKYRVRAYYKNYSKNKSFYGAWSSWKYFDRASISGKTTNKKKGISVTLKKGANVSKYVVYTSTKRDSGYKKAKTIKVSGKKSYTFQLTKHGSSKLKKGKTYYVQIVPYITANKKTYKSDIYTIASAYIFK